MKTTTHLLAVVLLAVTTGCQESKSGDTGSTTAQSAVSSTPDPSTPPAQSETAGQEVTTPSGLKYQDLVVGTGAEAVLGKVVSVHYTGWLTNGTQFDSSRERGTPIEFPLGTTGIIRGWNEGIAGMKVGGKRKLTIPPSLGYGEEGRGPIPANATMLFDVELVAVK